MMSSSHNNRWADPQDLTEVELGRSDDDTRGGDVRAWPPPRASFLDEEEEGCESSVVPTLPESPTGSTDELDRHCHTTRYRCHRNRKKEFGHAGPEDTEVLTFTLLPGIKVDCTYRHLAAVAVVVFGIAAVVGFLAGTGVFASSTGHAAKYGSGPTTPTTTAGESSTEGEGGCAAAQIGKIVAVDGTEGDYFGRSVAVGGDTVVVGAPQDDDNLNDGSSVYVFNRKKGMTAWEQTTKLAPHDGSASDYFGGSVSMDGDTIIVGAYLADDENGSRSGSAYVFTRSASQSGQHWRQQVKLVPLDVTKKDGFGYSVALSGDTAVIGAPFSNYMDAVRTGAAYIFTRTGTTWVHRQKLVPSDGMLADSFGSSVDISGDTIIVGASGHDYMGDLSGSAYVYVRVNRRWERQAKLLPRYGATAGDSFGSSVAIHRNTAVVGAKYTNDHGVAYVFVRLGELWKEQGLLLPTDAPENAINFGDSVAIDGNTCVVGAKYDSVSGAPLSGSVSVFTRKSTAWNFKERVVPVGLSAEDRFGYSVAIDGDSIIVGAISDDDKGKDSGSVYAVDLC